jgi:hypothetical protein
LKRGRGGRGGERERDLADTAENVTNERGGKILIAPVKFKKKRTNERGGEILIQPL